MFIVKVHTKEDNNMDFPNEWIKTYELGNETAQSVGYALAEYLDRSKDMVTQTMRTRNGYVIQCKGDVSAEWTKYLGMDAALSIDLAQSGSELKVTITLDRWMEKAGIAAVGAFVLHPLLLTAGIGAIRQMTLINEVFEFISQTVGSQPVEDIAAERAMPKDGTICPECGMINKSGAKFCKACGTALVKEQKHCPACNAELEGDEYFCPHCGAKL